MELIWATVYVCEILGSSTIMVACRKALSPLCSTVKPYLQQILGFILLSHEYTY